MDKLQEKLLFLLDKYSVKEKAVLKDKKTVTINDYDIPLLSHRSERRFAELKKMASDGTLSGISVMRTARIINKNSDIKEALYREFDLCQWILGKKICQITAMKNDNTLNVIAATEDSIVCTIEIAATLNDGINPIDKHEIIAQHGIACDVVVDAQLKQDSVYVFSDTNQKYTDVDFELYGLTIEEISIVRAAFLLAQNEGRNENLAADKYLNRLVDAAYKSAEKCERTVL